VELRERLAVGEEQLAEALCGLKSRANISETCIISTCNRTEVYAVTASREDDAALVEFLAEYGGISLEDLGACVYSRPGHHAVAHLFEVACGLDSMALGETQILGQIRGAYCVACDCHSTATVLNNLFQRAIAVGKRVRTETAISRGSFSIGSAAVDLARFVFRSLHGRSALLLGAGKMSDLAARHLRADGVERLLVCSRTPEKVERLVEELDGEAVPVDKFEEAIHGVDVVISSTSTREPIITRELMERVMAARARTPIFLIDIAVPRDVEPEVAQLDGVFLYNIDDLKLLVDRSRSDREAEVAKVRAIIDQETADFMADLRSLEAVPVIRELRDKLESVYLSEWQRCSTRLTHLSEEDREVIRKAMKSAVTKLAHDPILRMKDYAANGGAAKLDVARELFGLKNEDDDQDR
jgi:glutamyl-tRNA reductase